MVTWDTTASRREHHIFWKCVPFLHQMLKTYPASRPASHHHQQQHHDSSPITQHPSSIIIIIIIIIIGQTPLQPDTASDRHCFSYAPLRVVPTRRRLGQPVLQSCTGSVGHCFVRTRPRPTSRSDDACVPDHLMLNLRPPRETINATFKKRVIDYVLQTIDSPYIQS